MIIRWLIRVCVLAVIVNGNILDNNPLNKRNITEKTGMACAYGDFNQDRNTDVLHYHKGKLYVLLQQEKDFSDIHFEDTKHVIITLDDEYAEIACSVGDINNDGYIDIVVSTRKPKNGKEDNGKHWTVSYYLTEEHKDENNLKKPQFIFVQGVKTRKALHQVALIDVTGDGLHDLVGIQEDGNLLCLMGGQSTDDALKNPCEGIFLDWSGSIHPLMPILYGDVNNDLDAELVFMKEEEKGIIPEIWTRLKNKTWIKLANQLPPPDNGVTFKYTLAPLLFDLNLDAIMDFVVPICKDKSCATIENLQATHWDGLKKEWAKWTTIAIDLGQGKTIVEEEDTLVRMKAGDANLDGYPDLLVTIGTTKGPNNYAAVLENIPSEEQGKWKFENPSQMLIMPGLALGMVQSSSFFDFAEDGNLDIIVQWKLRDGDDWQWSLCISESEKQDATFLKVQTFAPLVPPGNIMKIGKGVVWGGACVTYEMETTGIGEKRKAIECQVPSNSHKAGLSPPFVLFGLGRSPNFIDEAKMGVPREWNENGSENDKILRYHTQKQIVPNARMMVQPPHINGNGGWTLRLFLTPSTLIYSSLIVMASVCVILLIVVIILHYREKKVDRVERAAQSHRFHFDAM